MITKPTVFILGAGASVPYGLPTGRELTKAVCKGIWSGSFVSDLGASGARELERYSTMQAKKMADMLNRSSLTIDTWLGQNSDWHDLGKFFITKAIAERENEADLNKQWKGNKNDSSDKSHDWYGELWQWLNPPKLHDLSKNTVTFITFNYDRSLEQALLTKAMNSFDRATQDMCVQELSKIDILHVHGQIGRLPWQDYLRGVIETERVYEPKIAPGWIWPCAKHIKIIGEADLTSPEYEKARSAIRSATRLHFIGFGFNEDNMKRLRTDFSGLATASCNGLEHWKKELLKYKANPLGFVVLTDDRFDDVVKYAQNMVEGWGDTP